MSKKDVFEPEKIFDDCDWSSRNSVEETLKQYIGAIVQALVGATFSEEETVKVTEAFSDAILEDIEVDDYSRELWDSNTKCSEGSKKYEVDEDEIFNSFIEQIFADDSIDETGSSKHGIASYTMRYDKKDYRIFGELLKLDKEYLDKHVGEKLYQKIYPIFWLEMLNKRHNRKSDNEKCLIWPIYRGIEREQYIFALLSDKRKKDMQGGTIFSGIKRILTKNCKRKGVSVKQYNMRNVKDRHDFVRWMKNHLFADKTPGNRNKVVFSNNIVTVREMLEIGTKRNIDIPAFIFFLDRLTGWIEFYNFVLLEDSIICESNIEDIEDDEIIDDETIAELQVKFKENEEKSDEYLSRIAEYRQKDDFIKLIGETKKYVFLQDEDELEFDVDAGLDYAAFEELAEYNHIAFLYVFGTYVRKNKEFNEIYHTIIGKEIIHYVNIAYDRIKHNRQCVQRQGSLAKESKWYRKLFEELFVNDISKVSKATRMEALNFYDAYITYDGMKRL